MLLIARKGGKENVAEEPNSIQYGTRLAAVKAESGAAVSSSAQAVHSCVIVTKRWKNEVSLTVDPKKERERFFSQLPFFLLSFFLRRLASYVPHFVRSLSNLKLGKRRGWFVRRAAI